MPGQIVYKDIAPGAADDAEFSAADKTAFSTLALSDDAIAERTVTLERNRWLLDGTFTVYDGSGVHLWSASLSGENCAFTTPPVLTVEFDEQYTTTGVTLIFDGAADEWASEVNIKWYQGDTLKADEDFTPDAATYFCQKNVVAFDKLVITFSKTSLPNRRLRLDRVVFGVIRIFGMGEIVAANAINETDLLSAELPASQLDWTLNSRNPVEYMFQLKQPIEMRADNTLIGVYYITHSTRISRTIYQVTAQDAIGVLSEQPYSGGVWLNGVSAKELFSAIVDGAFDVDYDTVSDTTLYGLIQPMTKREAIQQVLFAWGKCVRTDGGYTIVVFDQPTEPTEITAHETYNGVSIETAPIVTQVIVTAHTYTQDEKGSVEIGGVKYLDTPSAYVVDNPDVTANDLANVVTVEDATLVSTHNGAATAQRVYNHYARRNTHRSKVIYNGEHLGDCLQQPTPWETQEIGNVRSVSVTLSGIVAADIESLGVEA